MNDDLISRSALLEEFDWVNRATAGEGNYEEDLRLLVKRVTEMPAEDAEIVRHGYWVDTPIGIIKCNLCGAGFNIYKGFVKYCGSCGAKMDAEVVGC